MPSLSERLANEGQVPELREPEDADNPQPDEAPFELKEARPLSQSLGDFLTEPTWAGEDANPDVEDANPDVVLQRGQNPELTVWISRFGNSGADAYVLTCWGWEHQMHFDVPKETVADVIKQGRGVPTGRSKSRMMNS